VGRTLKKWKDGAKGREGFAKFIFLLMHNLFNLGELKNVLEDNFIELRCSILLVK